MMRQDIERDDGLEYCSEHESISVTLIEEVIGILHNFPFKVIQSHRLNLI
jgi:hypothetical protein